MDSPGVFWTLKIVRDTLNAMAYCWNYCRGMGPIPFRLYIYLGGWP